MDADELKQIFRAGWNHPSVVAHRVERFLHGEFGFEPSRQAWLSALGNVASQEQVRKVVDMGTGPGTIAQLWAELGCDVTGVDFSPAMLATGREAAERRGLAIEFVEGDVERPTFADATFDAVSSRAVLFTLPHPGYAVARWIRLLRPGGLLVLIGENSPNDPEKLKRQYRPAPGWKPSDEYLKAMEQLPFRNHTDAMARVVMEAAGLTNIHSISMQAVIDARLQHEALQPEYGVLQGTPYMLVGQRC